MVEAGCAALAVAESFSATSKCPVKEEGKGNYFLGDVSRA
jgi:hypothetical protein